MRIGTRGFAWWRHIGLPVRRVWLAVCARVKARKKGGGVRKLHNDVETCSYQDVQVMWEMLKKSEEVKVVDTSSLKRKRTIWRLPFWSNRSELRG